MTLYEILQVINILCQFSVVTVESVSDSVVNYIIPGFMTDGVIFENLSRITADVCVCMSP